MKKILYVAFSLFLACGVVSCDKNEDKLTQSNLEVDRLSAQVDLTKPIVKEYKEKYDVNIVYNPDVVADIKSQMLSGTPHQIWNDMDITLIDGANVDFTLDKLEEYVLDYFTETSVLKQKFPGIIYLVDYVKKASATHFDATIIGESTYKITNHITAIGTDYFYLFGFNKELIDMGAEDEKIFDQMRSIYLYNFICAIVDKYDLYSEIPEEFYLLPAINGLHGTLVAELANKGNNLGDETNGTSKDHYKASWYMGLGMAMTKYSPISLGAGDFNKVLKKDDEYIRFPNKERDFRNFLNVVFCDLNSDNIANYYSKSANFKIRMKIVLELLDKWGVDYIKINPELAIFKNS